MISKELFEIVFNGCTFSGVEDNYIVHYSQPCTIMKGSWINDEITVYELAHECKKWALLNELYLYSATMTDRCYCNVYDFNHNLQFDITANTEPETNFKACQWILDNRECKQ